ncbi:MAG: ROK family transcriptional regulator [Candidatus Vecturithrix sp.]|jgi:predicted NBD/HSP70 family sugar kinase|nr:ROK family transcriptional regulator [Candidatus Vecturithrix sp.]
MQNANGKNAKLIKIHNRSLALRIIQQNSGISRKDIATLTGLTQATITKITRDLLEQGLIQETDNEDTSTSSGRKPIGLTINREKYKIIAVYAGRRTLKSALFDLAGNLLYQHECQVSMLNQDSRTIVQAVKECIQKILQGYPLTLSDVLGIGVSAPGPINAQKGILLGSGETGRTTSSAAPFDWRDVPIKQAIQEQFGIQVFADNDANVSALAESWFGYGVGVSNFVLYSIGVGIGAGVIIDGMLYRGEDDVVAEIGHITVDAHGAQCICGNFGCLELYGSFADLVCQYQKAAADTSLSSIESLFQAAGSGYASARSLIQQKAHYLGIGAVSLANIFSPEYVFVAPNDIDDVDLSMIVAELQESVKKRAFSVIANKVTVLPSKLGKDIHLYGGVALVLQDFFQMLPP